jgi:hypothetical protein
MIIFLSLIMFIMPPSVLLSHHLGQLQHPPAAIHSWSLPIYLPLQGPHTQLNSRSSPFMCFSYMHSICGMYLRELHQLTARPEVAHGGAHDSTSAQLSWDAPLSWYNINSTEDMSPSWRHDSWASKSKGKKYYKSLAGSSNWGFSVLFPQL